MRLSRFYDPGHSLTSYLILTCVNLIYLNLNFFKYLLIYLNLNIFFKKTLSNIYKFKILAGKH